MSCDKKKKKQKSSFKIKNLLQQKSILPLTHFKILPGTLNALTTLPLLEQFALTTVSVKLKCHCTFLPSLFSGSSIV